MRRSPFMNVPSFSNDEHAGRKIVACARAVSLRKRSCTTSVSRLARAASVSVRFGWVCRMSQPTTHSPRTVPASGGVEHLHRVEPVGAWDRRSPDGFEAGGVGERRVPSEMVGFTSHVRGALHVVLSAQRIDAAAGLSDVAGQQREVRDARDAVGALGVFGDTEPMERHRRTVGRVQASGDPEIGSVDTAKVSDELRREAGEMPSELIETLDALLRERLVDQTLLDDRRAHRVEYEHVRAGPRPQMHRRRTRRARCAEGR